MRYLTTRAWLLTLSAFASHASATETTEAYFHSSFEASSEPVPIHDMIHGWEGSVDPGEYAFGDAFVRAGIRTKGFVLGLERRYFYSMQFTPETVAWYLELDRGIETTEASDIFLDVQSFDGRGVTGGYEFSGDQWSLMPLFTLYKIGHYQFGRAEGVTTPGEGIDASVFLRYHFDEDKILDYQAEEGDRFGYALSLQGSWSHPAGVSLSFELRDLWNQLEFAQASSRLGCVNFGRVDENICDFGESSAEGKDSNEDFSASIPMTLVAELDYQPHLISAGVFWHDHYQRFTLGKGWMLRDEYRVDALATSLKQVGARLTHRSLSLQVLTDDLRPHFARDAHLELSYRYAW